MTPSPPNVTAASPGDAKFHAIDRGALHQQVLSRLGAARLRFGVSLDPLLDRLLETLDSGDTAQSSLEEINIEDMYLAHACCCGDKEALMLFSERCDKELRAVVAKMRLSPSDFDDFRQQLWNKLFLGGANGEKKALEYRGTGHLHHWFRIVATRALLDDRRRAKRGEPPSTPEQQERLGPSALGADPEMECIRQQYRFAFKTAFDLALKALEPEERNLLRLHHVLGKTTEQIAEILGTHKATAARHIAKAREKLTKLTRRELKSRLRANSMELDSAMRLFDGELTCSWGDPSD